MFLKTAQIKKMMKAALKGAGLYVGNTRGSYMVWAAGWGLETDAEFASNKFKAAVTELIGDIPMPEETCRFYMENGDVVIESAEYPGSAYAAWRAAKDFAVSTPLVLRSWPHEFAIYQVHSNHEYLTLRRSRTHEVISSKELDTKIEGMPGNPNCIGSRLYWKNDTTIYWVDAEQLAEKVREIILPCLSGLDFFQGDWLLEAGHDERDESDNELPYA